MNTDVPLAVQCGLLSQDDNDYLAQCKLDQDWDSYVAAAKPLCQDSDALFGHLLMGNRPQPHFWPIDHLFQGPDNIMLKVVRKGGKALALDTPIPTPNGWKTMGDLKVGDEVFDETGRPCRVTFATEVQHNRRCYRVEFNDGSTIVADAEHRWLTRDKKQRSHTRGRAQVKCPLPPSVRTTEEILATIKTSDGRESNHSIDVAGAWQLPERDLPIEPYLLGAWLGDGAAHNARITNVDQEILDAFPAAGYEIHQDPTDRITWHINDRQRVGGVRKPDSFYGKLSRLGLIGNKHIPADYMMASEGQRFALLQGLMDTDGTADRKKSRVSFTSTNPTLADQFFELVAGLGFVPHRRTRQPKIPGRPDAVCKEAHEIYFITSKPVFRLKRKLEAMDNGVHRNADKRRIIKNVVPVESVPVRCIQVDSPNHLYLAGRSSIPTHNTENKLFPPIIRRICYAIDGVSQYKDPRILAIVESGDRRDARMRGIQRKLDRNPLLVHAFADNDDGFSGMADEWSTKVINIPKASGTSSEATLACITPNVASAGMQPKLFVGDDVATPANSRTEGKAKAVVTFWKDIIEPLQTTATRTFYYYTPYYVWDLAVSHLEPSGMYRVIKIPGMNRMPTRADYRFDTTDEGLKTNFRLTDRGLDLQSPWPCPLGDESACPGTQEHFDDVGYHRPVLAQLRVFETSPRTFITQHMLEMADPEGQVIAPRMLRFYTDNPRDKKLGQPATMFQSEDDFPGEEMPTVVKFPDKPDIVHCTHGWDFGYGKKRSNDPSALCRMYRTKNNNFFLKFHTMKEEYDDIVSRIATYANSDPIRNPDTIVVEGGGTQKNWKTSVDRALRERSVRHHFKLEEAKRFTDKNTKFVESMLPDAMGQGLVFVDINDREAIDELFSITADESSLHDDRFDAMVNAYQFAADTKLTLRLGPKSGSAFLSR